MSQSVSDVQQLQQFQQRLEELNPTDADYRPSLLGLLNHKDLKSYIQGLEQPDLERVVELLDGVSEANSYIYRG